MRSRCAGGRGIAHFEMHSTSAEKLIAFYLQRRTLLLKAFFHSPGHVALFFFFFLHVPLLSFPCRHSPHSICTKTKNKKMRANTLILTLAISILLSCANAAPAPIPIADTPDSLESVQTDTAQPTPPSDLAHTVEAALGSIADIFQSFNNGVSSPESDQTDWSCQLTDEHPNPAIMLHGLIAPSFTR